MIKWIGQHIFDLISRFRSTVYLENLETSTETNILVVDSDGKVTKNPDAGDDTVFVLEDGDGTEVSISDGKEIKFVEGGGIDINWTDTDNGTDADPYDLTFTVNKTLSDFLADTSGVIEHLPVGQDVTIGSPQDIILHIDKDDSSDSKDDSSTVTIRNGAGTDILTIDESGNIVTRGTITAQTAGGVTKYPSKGSAGNFLVDDAGAIKTRTATNIMADLSGQAGADFAMNSQKITGVSDPTSSQDAATKAYVDITRSVAQGGTGATTLTANSILTGNGTSAVQAESTLSYNSGILDIGVDDDSAATIRRLRHTDDEGGELYIRGGDASGTDKEGGALRLYGGRGTSNGVGGAVTISTSTAAGSSGSTLHTSQNIVATFKANKDVQLTGNLVFEGPTPDAHETTFSITDPTDDRTVTVPDADVDLTKVRAATTSLDGVVELATTAEADTGTDTTRAITAAGLKSHVDTRYHYQYISFLSNMTTASNWKTVSNNGISNHSWNQSLGTNGTTVGTSTGTVPVATIVGGIVVPYDCTLVGFKAIGMGGSDHQYELGLMVGVPTFNDYASFDVTLRAYKAAVAGAEDNNYESRAIAIEDLTRSYSITAGHMIYPCVKSASGSGTNKVSWTIVLKTLIPS